MSSYLMKYKGIYRLKSAYDLRTNQFPRKLNGTFEDIDMYIDAKNGVRIYHYGGRILECYIPSIKRGHNIIKEIQSDLGNEVVFNIVETDVEILFRFNSKDMELLESYLKPKTFGANISPYSSRNLPRNKSYKIPDEESLQYKAIVEKIGQKRIIELTHITNSFLQSLVTKKNTWEDIKADMALKGLSGKNYIHSIGKWNEYISYLERNIK